MLVDLSRVSPQQIPLVLSSNKAQGRTTIFSGEHDHTPVRFRSLIRRLKNSIPGSYLYVRSLPGVRQSYHTRTRLMLRLAVVLLLSSNRAACWQGRTRRYIRSTVALLTTDSTQTSRPDVAVPSAVTRVRSVRISTIEPCTTAVLVLVYRLNNQEEKKRVRTYSGIYMVKYTIVVNLFHDRVHFIFELLSTKLPDHADNNKKSEEESWS